MAMARVDIRPRGTRAVNSGPAQPSPGRLELPITQGGARTRTASIGGRLGQGQGAVRRALVVRGGRHEAPQGVVHAVEPPGLLVDALDGEGAQHDARAALVGLERWPSRPEG